jgi:hypothetical protein
MLAFLCCIGFWFVLFVVVVSSVGTLDQPLCPKRKPIPLRVGSSCRISATGSFHTMAFSTNSGLWTGPRLGLGGVYASAFSSLLLRLHFRAATWIFRFSILRSFCSLSFSFFDSALYASGDSMGGRSARGWRRAGGFFLAASAIASAFLSSPPSTSAFSSVLPTSSRGVGHVSVEVFPLLVPPCNLRCVSIHDLRDDFVGGELGCFHLQSPLDDGEVWRSDLF